MSVKIVLVNRCPEACLKNSQHQFILIEMGWYQCQESLGSLKRDFSLDNFDVIFLHRLCVNRFVSVLLITIIVIYL